MPLDLSFFLFPVVTDVNDIDNPIGDPDYPSGGNFTFAFNRLIAELELRIPVNTGELTELGNLYYTDARARNSISVLGSGGSYNPATGEITITASQGIDHVSETDFTPPTHTITVWGDSGETINLGTFTVDDGGDGEDGQGIDHTSLTTTVGLVQTYTVWGDVVETLALGTFSVTNGQPVDHVSQTSTSGLQDTYTVWGDSGETVNLGTFTVTNGQDGSPGSVTSAGAIILTETTPPTTGVSEHGLFVDNSDGKLYRRLPQDGSIEEVGSGAGGSSEIGDIGTLLNIWLFS